MKWVEKWRRWHHLPLEAIFSCSSSLTYFQSVRVLYYLKKNNLTLCALV